MVLAKYALDSISSNNMNPQGCVISQDEFEVFCTGPD